MPPCKKELKIKSSSIDIEYISAYCCESEGHEGHHQWHVWTDADNPATGEKGIIKVIN